MGVTVCHKLKPSAFKQYEASQWNPVAFAAQSIESGADEILNLVNSAWLSVDVSATQIAFELCGTL